MIDDHQDDGIKAPVSDTEPTSAPDAKSDPGSEADVAAPETGPAAVPPWEVAAARSGEPANAPAPDTAAATATAIVSPAVEKFRSCRWRATPEDGEFCTHRDVLPFAGKEGFVAVSWCPDCAFYKLRRTPKKRERLDFTY